MEIVLGLLALASVVAAVVLLISRGEIATALAKSKSAHAEARREADAATKKLSEFQSVADKGQGEATQATAQLKEAKAQISELKEELKALRKKAKGADDERESFEKQIRRASSKHEELEAEVIDLRERVADLKQERDRAAAEAASVAQDAAERLAQKAADSPTGVSEDEVRRAVADARKAAAREASREAAKDVEARLGRDIEKLKDRVNDIRRQLAEKEAELRRTRKRYTDAQQAYAITQGQLEMADDRIYFLETGKHRRPHRPEAIATAELRVNTPERIKAAAARAALEATSPDHDDWIDDEHDAVDEAEIEHSAADSADGRLPYEAAAEETAGDTSIAEAPPVADKPAPQDVTPAQDVSAQDEPQADSAAPEEHTGPTTGGEIEDSRNPASDEAASAQEPVAEEDTAAEEAADDVASIAESPSVEVVASEVETEPVAHNAAPEAGGSEHATDASPEAVPATDSASVSTAESGSSAEDEAARRREELRRKLFGNKG